MFRLPCQSMGLERVRLLSYKIDFLQHTTQKKTTNKKKQSTTKPNTSSGEREKKSSFTPHTWQILRSSQGCLLALSPHWSGTSWHQPQRWPRTWISLKDTNSKTFSFFLKKKKHKKTQDEMKDTFSYKYFTVVECFPFMKKNHLKGLYNMAKRG